MNSWGVTSPIVLCVRSSLYSRRHASITSCASCRVTNKCSFRHSSRNCRRSFLALGDLPDPRQSDSTGGARKKALKPMRKRALVRDVLRAHPIGVRRACGLLRLNRASVVLPPSPARGYGPPETAARNGPSSSALRVSATPCHAASRRVGRE